MKRTEQNQSFQTNLTQFRKSLEIGRQAWKAEADLKRSQEQKKQNDRKSSRTNGKSTGISKMSKAPPSATHPGRLGIEIVDSLESRSDCIILDQTITPLARVAELVPQCLEPTQFLATDFELEVGIWYGRAFTISKRRLAVLRAYQSWQYDKLTWAGCQILNPMNPAHVHKFDKLFRTGCHGFSIWPNRKSGEHNAPCSARLCVLRKRIGNKTMLMNMWRQHFKHGLPRPPS